MTLKLHVLDTLIGLLGFCAGIVALLLWLVLQQALMIWVAGILLASCSLYLLGRPYLDRVQDKILIEDEAGGINWFNSFSFVVICGLAFIAWLVQTYSNARATGFLVVILCMTIFIAANLARSVQRSTTSLLRVLFEIILLGVVLRASMFFATPGLIGNDPWFHFRIVEIISTSGSLPSPVDVQWYSSFPAFHLIVSEFSILTGITAKDAMFLSVGIVESISVISVFLLTRRYLGARMGLLAAFLLTITSYHIRYGVVIIPMTIGIVFLPCFVYLISELRSEFAERKRTKSALLMILFLAVLITHPLSSTVILVAISCFYVASLVVNRIGMQVTAPKRFLGPLILTFGVMTLGYWSLGAWSFFESFVLSPLGSFLNVLSYSLRQVTIESSISQPSLAMFFSFSIIGSLILLRKSVRDTERVQYVLAAWTFSLLVLAAIVFNRTAILPQRWLVFVAIMMVLPVALGIISVSAILANLVTVKSHNRLVRLAMAVAILSVLCTLMITDPQANPDGSFGQPRSSFTVSELQSMGWLQTVSRGNIFSDTQFVVALRNGYNYTSVFESTGALVEGNFSQPQSSVLVVRAYVLISRGENMNLSQMNLGPQDLIYDSKDVVVLYKP